MSKIMICACLACLVSCKDITNPVNALRSTHSESDESTPAKGGNPGGQGNSTGASLQDDPVVQCFNDAINAQIDNSVATKPDQNTSIDWEGAAAKCSTVIAAQPEATALPNGSPTSAAAPTPTLAAANLNGISNITCLQGRTIQWRLEVHAADLCYRLSLIGANFYKPVVSYGPSGLLCRGIGGALFPAVNLTGIYCVHPY